MFETKLRKVGNSHAVILPAELVKAWGLSPGDPLSLYLDADRAILRPTDGRRGDFIQSLERVTREDETLLAALADE
jgi:antitoxin component of MazEF toxin-antitoxin module